MAGSNELQPTSKSLATGGNLDECVVGASAPEPTGRTKDPWAVVAGIPWLEAAMRERGIKPLQLESPDAAVVADGGQKVMDIGDTERRNGLDELEWEMSRNAAGAEPEPGLPS